MDTFFTQSNCDRCGKELKIRITSWFTKETICMDCKHKEDMVRSFLPLNGREHEGCGHMPEQCDHCNGYGSSLKESAEKCTQCGGIGLTVGAKL